MRPRVPDAVREQVRARTHGKCQLCLFEMGYRPPYVLLSSSGGGARRIAHLHHVLDEQHFPDLAAEADNLMGLCFDHHMAHHGPGVNDTRIPREALMHEARELAADDGPRSVYFDRHYPITAAVAEPRHDTTEDAQHG